MHNILVIRLYFPLDDLRVSDYVSPSSGANFISCTLHLVYAGTMSLAYTSIYQIRCTAYNFALDDGLIYSETCRASNNK